MEKNQNYVKSSQDSGQEATRGSVLWAKGGKE